MNRKAFLTMVAAAAGAAMDEEIGNKPDLVVLPEICDVLQGVSPQAKLPDAAPAARP